MSPFNYPKLKQARQLSPPQYVRYGSYKRFLQYEFSRTCVYCRTFDTVAVGVVFGADHYRPKTHPLFGHLICSYDNLYYCCSACNSRKNNHWPLPGREKKDFIPNPCDHVMYKHLRYQGAVVDAVSVPGTFTQKLLDLNDPKVVAFRDMVIHLIGVLEEKVAEAHGTLKQIDIAFRTGTIAKSEADRLTAETQIELGKTQVALAAQRGTTPLTLPAGRTKKAAP